MDETPYRFESAFLEDAIPAGLADRVAQLIGASRDLPGRLPPVAAGELAGLVRIMNCYYSNLIEGHDTRPAEIERALAEPSAKGRRPLLQEALAHIAVQEHIDRLASSGALPPPTSAAFIKDVHRRFYEAMPAEYRSGEVEGGVVEVSPGAFRSRTDERVVVGRHEPPSPSRVLDFMAAFESRFGRGRRAQARVDGRPRQSLTQGARRLL